VWLGKLYRKYNRRVYIHPDPLEFVLNYDDQSDREIVALIASSLAYGRVEQILRSVSSVLDVMDRPSEFIADADSFRRRFGSFKHRFTTGDELVSFLLGIRGAIDKYGSLKDCFVAGYSPDDRDIFPALCSFVDSIRGQDDNCSSLLPSPQRGSACKRLNLFLKWMVRQDNVDPGGWSGVDKSKLIIPLDTHMYRIGVALGMTERKSADLKTAREITDGFKVIEPSDPTKYDFALTRLGMEFGANVADHLSGGN
jgi:uncharacterized protein (TIGR02757 family)